MKLNSFSYDIAGNGKLTQVNHVVVVLAWVSYLLPALYYSPRVIQSN